jgi:hypothetical protein
MSKSASFLVSEGTPGDRFSTGNWIAEQPDNGPKGKLPASMYELSSESGGEDGDEDMMDVNHVGPVASASSIPPPSILDQPRASYDRAWPSTSSSSTATKTPRTSTSATTAISAATAPPPSRTGSTSGKHRAYDIRHLEPWYHAQFAPLPRPILQGIRTINPGDMPTRRDFDAALLSFLAEINPELREVSAFPPEPYAAMASALVRDDKEPLSKRVADWMTHHHARPGSHKYHLLLLPREDYFSIPKEKEEALRAAYIADVDGGGEPFKPSAHAATTQEGIGAFDRVPVSPQIYDVLVYAHKKHPNSSVTLAETRNAGIVSFPFILPLNAPTLSFHLLILY